MDKKFVADLMQHALEHLDESDLNCFDEYSDVLAAIDPEGHSNANTTVLYVDKAVIALRQFYSTSCSNPERLYDAICCLGLAAYALDRVNRAKAAGKTVWGTPTTWAAHGKPLRNTPTAWSAKDKPCHTPPPPFISGDLGITTTQQEVSEK